MPRSKYLLAMAFPDTVTNNDIYEKFGADINIISEE